MVEGDEKPRVCGVVEGDDESCPESDFEIRPGKKNTKSEHERSTKMKPQKITPTILANASINLLNRFKGEPQQARNNQNLICQ